MTLFKAAKLSDVVRRKSWEKNIFFVHSEKLGFSCIIFEEGEGTTVHPLHISKDDLFATDWEVKF